MSYFSKDPSAFIDDDIIKDLVETFSELIRKDHFLREWQVDAIGNQWEDFESEIATWLIIALTGESQRRSPFETSPRAARLATTDENRRLHELFTESCLVVAPFYTAALTAGLLDLLLDDLA